MEQRIKSHDDLFQCMPELGEQMEELGCVCAKPAYCFTHFLEPDHKEDDILVEICEAVTERKADSGDLKLKFFPEIPKAACMFHKGSYGEIHKSYTMLLNYIEENGYEIDGNMRELSFNIKRGVEDAFCGCERNTHRKRWSLWNEYIQGLFSWMHLL